MNSASFRSLSLSLSPHLTSRANKRLVSVPSSQLIQKNEVNFPVQFWPVRVQVQCLEPTGNDVLTLDCHNKLNQFIGSTQQIAQVLCQNPVCHYEEVVSLEGISNQDDWSFHLYLLYFACVYYYLKAYLGYGIPKSYLDKVSYITFLKGQLGIF